MRILVTGGSGFTGQRVLRQARDEGHEVVALVRSASAGRVAEGLGATPVAGDLDDPASLDVAFRVDADVLVNVASLGFGHAPAVVSAAEEAGIRRAVFVSTTAITTTLPASSKRVRLAAESAIRGSSLDWTIIRPTMIYGAAGDRNLARLIRLMRRTRVVVLPGGGHRLQQPVHVEDLAASILAAATTDAAIGQTYDVAGPDPMSLRDLVLEVGSALGIRPVLITVPLRPTIAALKVYERLAPRPRLKSEQLERLAEDKAFSIADARRDLGYAPRSFSSGIGAEVASL
ncbi:MAG TPA: NAD(P)H-binding protein [Mycobacteriales bacterium]|nr:NAD(P)H-binding protein [Mycobacteriales bacterium]